MELIYTANDIALGIESQSKEDAIRSGAQLLIQSGKIKEHYIDEIFEVLNEYGPYFVLAPGIAFPHSKPSDSVLESGISLITLKEPVYFGSVLNDPVSIVCTIASIDSNDHLMLLKKMVGFLSNPENIKFLKSATSNDDIREISHRLNAMED